MYQTPSGQTTLENAILTILALVIIVIFLGAMYAFIMSIFQFIFSKGEPDKVKKAWNNIRYMILGLLLSIILLFVAPILFQRLQIPGYRIYTAQNIFKKATQLFKLLKDPNANNREYYPNNNSYGEEQLQL